jgi:hypothetical protein
MWYDSYWYLSMGDGSGWSYSLSALDASAALDGEWHHVAAVIDGYDWTVYVDGEEDCTWTATISAGTASAYTMRIAAASNMYFPTDGLIDEVAFFTSALSASDITAIYNSGTPASLESYSPYGWWRMGDNDGGTGTTITNQGTGSTSTDGTLTNGPTYSTDVPEGAAASHVTITVHSSLTIVDDQYNSDYKYFVVDGTLASAFTVTDAGSESGSNTIEVYLIAGGGGAGYGGNTSSTGTGGAGGGAGGYLRNTSYDNGSALAQVYDVTIGAGGDTGTQGNQTAGGDSVLTPASGSALTAVGGGYGGNYWTGGSTAGGDGGSGGGGSYAASAGGTGTTDQGNDGGDASSTTSGGGGGAGAAGSAPDAGDGVQYEWMDDSYNMLGPDGDGYFAGGGGGSGGSGGAGGYGGGGAGGYSGSAAGSDGAANSGGGGGGGWSTTSGGNGGSGYLIVRWKYQN